MENFGVYNNEIRHCWLNSNPTHCSIIQKSNLIFENLHDFIDIEKSNLIFENLHDFIDIEKSNLIFENLHDFMIFIVKAMMF